MRRRSRRSRRIRTRTIFFGGLLLALIVVWLPGRWTRPVGNITQLIAPVQDALNRGGDALAGTLNGADTATVPYPEYEEARLTSQALANRLLALSARVEELEGLNRDLSGLREAGFPREGRLIPARVIRRDAVAWRDAVLLDRGRSAAATADEWVISRKFINVGENRGVTDGLAVLAGETLVGRVLHVAPYTATVLLLSDPTMRLERVRVGRLVGERMELVEADFLLRGVGQGRMVIEDVDQKYLASPGIGVGDLVVSPPGDPGLSLTVAIGRITEIEPQEDSPLLLSRLHVEPLVAPDELTGVYVVDTTPPRGR